MPRVAIFDGADAVTPLSFGQQRLWFLHRLDPLSPAYNLTTALRFTGVLDREALAYAVDEVRRRHAVLRTTIEEVDGQVVQRVRPWQRQALQVVDRPLREGSDRPATAEALVLERAAIPFDLTHDEPLRVTLFTLADDEAVALFVLHHIASDAWSEGIMLEELAALYRARRSGQSAALPPPQAQYGDVARREAGRASSGGLDAGVSYWTGQLQGSERLALPSRSSRRPERALAVQVERRLPEGLSSGIAKLAASMAATPVVVLVAALQLLLGRVCRQRDVTIGATVANRSGIDVERLLGFFVNTVALRTTLSWNSTVRNLIANVRTVILEAMSHQDVPFEWVVERLRPDRDPEGHPIFEVLFNMVPSAGGSFELDGLRVDPVPLPRQWTHLPLEWNLVDRGDQLDLVVVYAKDSFEAHVIDQLMDGYIWVLRQMVDRPDTPLSEVSLQRPDAQHALWTQGAARVSFPPSPFVHERLAVVARDHPGATAITDGDTAVSYRELDERSNRLARRLAASGVGPEVRVGLCARPGHALVTAIAGILKAGGVYVPLDPDWPAERRALMVNDVRPAVIVVAGAADAASWSSGIPCIRFDDALAAGEPVNARDVHLDADNAAYVMYTSGSTGLPKGVVITHGNLARHLDTMREWLVQGPQDAWTLFHSFTFDVSVWEMWGCLTTAGRLVIVPKAISRSPEAFVRLTAKERVTIVNLTPAVFTTVLRDGNWPAPSAMPRCVILAGEAVDVQDLQSWFDAAERLPRLINIYGITETTVHTTSRVLMAADVTGPARSPIGIGLADLDIHVLDACGHLAGAGIAGEVFVGGAGLARGYWNRPDLTATRFVPDPWSPRPGARLYRTGDLARRLEDGSLEYLGRVDHQVKIRGFRIEPGEVEDVLRRHPGVRDAVVIAHCGRSGDARLVAYILSHESAPDRETLRSFAAHWLPDYMLPASVIALPALPLTANGKLDRARLPDPDLLPSPAPAASPRTSLERRIADIWASELAVERVGADDNLFDRGAHSLMLERVHRRLERELDRAFPLMMMFQFPTVRALAGQLGAPAIATADSASSGVVAVRPAEPAPVWSTLNERGHA